MVVALSSSPPELGGEPEGRGGLIGLKGYWIMVIVYWFKNLVLLRFSSARRKKQRSIHPLQTSPYMGKLKRKVAEIADFTGF
jgi:hypothetical protein